MPVDMIECIPNVSEGRDSAVIGAICDELSGVSGLHLLHRDLGPDANRTVLTMVGSVEALRVGIPRMYQVALERIDMRKHVGPHPRIGAVDVCPLVALTPEDKPQALKLASEVAKEVADLGVPVFLYEQSAHHDYRRRLFDIRRGEFEGLTEKMAQTEWRPDFGSSVPHPTFGATVVGVRELLVAFNITLTTREVGIANKIASEFRALRKSDERFSAARAIGWYMPSYGAAQVSINIIDINRLNLIDVFDKVKEIATLFGISVAGSELIGLCPERLLYTSNITDVPSYLGLSLHHRFDPEERVLERVLSKLG